MQIFPREGVKTLKSKYLLVMLFVFSIVLSACSDSIEKTNKAIANAQESHFSVGILLPDVGLGDQSFNDLAVNGLVKAQEELDIIWSYRDLSMVQTMEEGLKQLIEEDHDIIIGVGYSVQEVLEAYAPQYPEQQFVILIL